MNLLLKRNEGLIDRIIRVAVGLFLLSLTFLWPQTQWGWVGLVPLLTGIMGSCPIYTLLGLRTCSLPH